MPKKTKAIKHGDRKQNKAWLKKVKPSAYKIEKVATNKIILIVCEGQTEKLYFDSFEVLSKTVVVVDLKGQSKIQLVENTKELAKNNEYDEIWCVFDMDIKYDEVSSKPNFDNAIFMAKKLGYKIAYSNDAFELWFYLHYQYTENEEYRTFYYRKLSQFWNINYEKFGKQYKFSSKIYSLLEDDENASQKDAINRAEKLYTKQKDLAFHKQNPVTKVYALVAELNENTRN